MTRYDAVAALVRGLAADDVALFTTGMISREAFLAGDRELNLYMIGSMGLLSSVGLGLALSQPDRRVWVIEGDGSLLMTLGNLATIGAERPARLVHVVVDNGVYGSTGDQPTLHGEVSFAELARAAGYPTVLTAASPEELAGALRLVAGAPGPVLLHVRVEVSEVPGIGRVSIAPDELAQRLRLALSGAARVA